MKNFLLATGLLLLFSVPAGVIVAVMSPMFFDAPGSDKDPVTWLMYYCALAYPLLALIGPILSWTCFWNGRRRLSLVFMAPPLLLAAVPVGGLLISLIVGLFMSL